METNSESSDTDTEELDEILTDKDSGSDDSDTDIDDFISEDAESNQNLKTRIEKIFYFHYKPEYLDLCKEFADSEEFIVDCDALMSISLEKEGFLPEGTGDLSRLSSLHIIYLVEKALVNFQERGGVFSLVFFQTNQTSFVSPVLLLLRNVMIKHFQENSKLTVFTEFQDPFDQGFRSLVEKEKPCFILSSVNSTKNDLFFLQYHNLGLNFADVEDMTKTLVTVNSWYSMSSPGSRLFDALLRKFQLEFMDVESLLKGNLNINDQVGVQVTNVQKLTIEQFIMNSLRKVNSSSDNFELKALTNVFLASHLLQKHKGISARITDGVYYALDTSAESLFQIHLAQIYKHLNTDIDLVKDAHISDLIDSQFLLKTICKLQTMADEPDFTFLKLLEEEIDLKDNLVNYLNDLSTIWPEFNVDDLFNVKELEVVTKEISKEENLKSVQKINHPLYKEYTKGMFDSVTIEYDKQRNISHKVFEEKYHWHTLKKLSDDYDRTKENKVSSFNMKANQKQANFMVRYGTSIEGGIEVNKPIVARQNNKGKQTENEKSSVIKTRRDIKNKKFKKAKEEFEIKYKSLGDNASLERLNDLARCIGIDIGQINNEMKMSTYQTDKKKTKKKEDCVNEELKDTNDSLEKLLIKIHFQMLKISFNVIKTTNSALNDEEIAKHMLLVKQILILEPKLTEKHKVVLLKHLDKFGFSSLASTLNLTSEKEIPENSRSFSRFQLEHMGAFLEHDSPKEADRRVDNFNPDLWQRELFNAVDNRESALIIAPTSSGKTYAGYYCMESVLRESDDGVVVYVSPTKALVNQVAATVCARFSKRKVLTGGKTVYGMFTRDYRENALNCQILVTVPECLEILLLSPERPEWIRKLRFVIFDEVHNICGESRGEVWEHIMTLIRCPFLALSATVHNPGALHDWLQKAEDFKKERDRIDGIDISKRSYRVKLVPKEGKIDRHADLKKHLYTSEKSELKPLHPIATLKMATVVKNQKFPEHMTMSPKECIELYDALSEVLGKENVQDINTLNIFGEIFLKKTHIIKYNEVLKKYLLGKLIGDDLDSGLLEKLRKLLLPDGDLKTEDKNLQSEQKYLFKEFSKLILHLKEKSMLPAIVFTFNRSYCNILTATLGKTFRKAIIEVKSTEDYQKKEKETSKFDKQAEKEHKKKLAHRDKESSKENASSKGEESSKKIQHSNNDDLVSALQILNVIFRQFPKFTLVTKNTLGDQDAHYILQRLQYCLDLDFKNILKYGMSWHHAGNNARMRGATEMLFREKFLNLVVATTTLAQGIHMPCKTVVFAGDSVFLNSLNYHQCAGRAGRRGFDKDGHVIFFGIKSSKISRLLTANLPLMLGNNPTSLSLILRLFIMTGLDLPDPARGDMVSRALALLENPLIGTTNPEIKDQLIFFFMFCTEYLVKQDMININGKPIGFAGLASHLHYHEPFNFALCHLLQTGTLHSLCSKNSKGNISEDTLKELLVILSFLFARKKLNPISIERQRGSFNNSKVVLPRLHETVQNSMVEFNENIDTNFANYLQSASKIFSLNEENISLPISGTVFKQGKNKVSDSYSLLSPFATLSGKSNLNIGKDEIQSINSNMKSNLLIDTVPKLDFNDSLNSYALDFYNHGIYKSLVTDNGIREGEAFNLLKDFMLILKTISTSLIEIGPEDGLEEDLVIESFKQLSDQFQEKFETAFPGQSNYLPKGCQVIHPNNCKGCQFLEEGNKVVSLKSERRKFAIRERFTCESSWIVFVFTCLDCKIQWIGTSISNFALKMKDLMSEDCVGPAQRHLSHQVATSIVDGTNSGNFQQLKNKKAEWINKLMAKDIDVHQTY